jgi:hypothetical protein
MGLPEPDLNPPFLSGVRSAADPDFPVKYTRRAERKLFWTIVNSEAITGGGVRFVVREPGDPPQILYCDVSSLDPGEYWVSKFGRVHVAVAQDSETLLAGYVLDCRSFPPGPAMFFFREEREGVFAAATHPGRFTLSLDRLGRVQPDLVMPAGLFTRSETAFLKVTSLFGSQPDDTGWIARWFGPHDPDGQTEAIEAIAERLWKGASNPAVVVSAEPFVVAADSEVLDNVTLLRLPARLAADGPGGRTWEVGDRMVTCNGYGWTDDPTGDTPPGPRADGTWNDVWCVLADLLTDDRDRLAARKAEIPEEHWKRCRDRGAARLAGGDRCRDGRPWLSRVAVRDQRRRQWYRRGGYLK